MNSRFLMVLSVIGGLLLPLSACESFYKKKAHEVPAMRLALNVLTDRALRQGVSVAVWARVMRELGEHPASLNLAGLQLTADQLDRLIDVLLFSMKDEIIKLNIAHNQLEVLPESLREFRHLRILNVSSNQLVSLPQWLSRFTRLEEFSAADNLLCEIPQGIMGSWKRVRVLNVAGNQLSSLPSDLWSIDSVQEFNVSLNRLSMLPDAIAGWSSLRELYMFGNRGITLNSSIGYLSHLCVLHIDKDAYVPFEKPDLQIERIAVRGR